MIRTLRRSSAPSPYVAVAVRAFRRFATYRGATFAGVVTNTVFGFMYAGLFATVHATAGPIDGFDAKDTATYIFMAQAFLMMTGAFGDREISERVRTGDIAADLYRPVDFQLWWLAHDTGKAAFYALFRGIPPFVVGAIVLDLAIPTAPGVWIAFMLASVAGVILSFALRFIANLSAFWLLEARGVVAVAAIVQLFLSGHVVPLYMMPTWLESITRALPFAGITAHPVEIFLGAPYGGLVFVYLHQVVWITVLLTAGRMMLRAAQYKIVVQGG